jgi:hypothetical protein
MTSLGRRYVGLESSLTADDCCTLVLHEDQECSLREDKQALTWVELRGFEPLTPSMRTRCATGLRYSPKTGRQRTKPEGFPVSR